MSTIKKIRILNPDFNSDDAYSYFNCKLQDNLETETDRTILVLHENITANNKLCEWALDWKNKYLESGKLLSILTGKKSQSDALNGIYLKKYSNSSSICDLNNLYNELNEEDSNILELKNTFYRISSLTDQKTLKTTFVEVNDIIEITGEYCCKKCNEKIIVLKGEKAPECSAAECISPKSGWKLTLELF